MRSLPRRVWPPITTALEVLDRRLASGEISPEEYRERRELIGSAGERDLSSA